MCDDWKSYELRNQYRKERNKLPLYADLPTKDYKKWLNEKFEQMKKTLKLMMQDEIQ